MCSLRSEPRKSKLLSARQSFSEPGSQSPLLLSLLPMENAPHPLSQSPPLTPILVSLAYWPRAINRNREFKHESILIKVLNFNLKNKTKHHLTEIYNLDDMITGNCKRSKLRQWSLFPTFSFNSTDCDFQTRGAILPSLLSSSRSPRQTRWSKGWRESHYHARLPALRSRVRKQSSINGDMVQSAIISPRPISKPHWGESHQKCVIPPKRHRVGVLFNLFIFVNTPHKFIPLRAAVTQRRYSRRRDADESDGIVMQEW